MKKKVLNDNVATRRKFNRENLILCGFMVSTFDPKKNISAQKYCDSMFWREKKEQYFEPMLSVLRRRNQCQLRIEEKPKFPLVWSRSHFLFNFVGPKSLFCPSGNPKWIRSTCRGKPPRGSRRALFLWGV